MTRDLSFNAKGRPNARHTRAACTGVGDSTPRPDHLIHGAMPSRFIEPCLPSPADRPPSGSNWIHEIKHDGYRLMARRDTVGIRLITRRGNDWTTRFPLIVEAVTHLKCGPA